MAGKTTAGRDADAVTSTTSTAATRRGADRPTTSRAPATPVTVTPASPTAPTTPVPAPAAPVAPERRLPEPSPRTDVAVNVGTVERAFLTGQASQSVGYVQHVLRARGFDPGNITGIVDHATRAAYADFQRSIDELPTGLPTERSLDYLGFDVVG